MRAAGQTRGRRTSLYAVASKPRIDVRLGIEQLWDLDADRLARMTNEQLVVVRAQLKELSFVERYSTLRQPTPFANRFALANNEMKLRGLFAYQRRAWEG